MDEDCVYCDKKPPPTNSNQKDVAQDLVAKLSEHISSESYSQTNESP